MVRREHDLPPSGAVQKRIEPALPFNVHILRAELQRASQQLPALFLAAGKSSAFPLRPAGDDDREAASVERPGHIRISDQVETQLDEVGLAHVITPFA